MLQGAHSDFTSAHHCLIDYFPITAWHHVLYSLFMFIFTYFLCLCLRSLVRLCPKSKNRLLTMAVLHFHARSLEFKWDSLDCSFGSKSWAIDLFTAMRNGDLLWESGSLSLLSFHLEVIFVLMQEKWLSSSVCRYRFWISREGSRESAPIHSKKNSI